MLKSKISVIGLGKLGTPLLACFASRGHEVIGVDLNPDFVNLINQGKSPVSEPGIPTLLRKNKKRIKATQAYKEAILNSNFTFIIVPTPSSKDGRFLNSYVKAAGKEIGKALKEKQGFHLVSLVSTVSPGATESELLPILEKYSGKKAGKGFGLCYNPTFIALGSAIFTILYPDFILIGEQEKKSGNLLEKFYQALCPTHPPIKRMATINAEITKIALNTYVTTKISYANMLAQLCERTPEGDVDAVTGALGCDSRIGSKYLKGALGYGGPCFPRDNRALLSYGRGLGIPLPLAEATDKINQKQIPNLIRKIVSLLSKKGKVGILGLSYKPDTDVIEESQSLLLAKALLRCRIPVIAYDPRALENTRKVLENKIIFASSARECVRRADIIVLATPWPEFRKIKKIDFKNKKLIDCWRFWGKPKQKQHLALGIN